MENNAKLQEIPKLNSLQVTVEEVARIALEVAPDAIAHELDLSDEALQEVREYLEAKLQDELDTQQEKYDL